MTRLFLLLSICGGLLAQSPIQQFLPITVTGGTTLVDSSGNGNNGTLNGTTIATSPASMTCNGTSDWVSLPPLVNNSNFTALLVATGTAGGYVWNENDTTGGTNYIRMSTQSGNSGISGTGGSSNLTYGNMPAYPHDPHMFYFSRMGYQETYGIWDQNISLPGTLGAAVTVANTLGALCARQKTASEDLYWAGTIYGWMLFNGQLTQTQMQAQYNVFRAALAAQGTYLRDVVTPLYPSRVWQPIGTVLDCNGSTSGGCAITAEPTVLYGTGTCTTLSNPCFQFWYRGGSGTAGLYYMESADGIHWPLPSTATLAQSTLNVGPTVVASGGTLYLYEATTSGAVNCYTSTNPASFTLVLATCVTGTTLWNTTVVPPPGGSGTWYMVSDQARVGGPQGCTGYTATDGIHWAAATANPVTGKDEGGGCNAPWLTIQNGTFYAYSGPLTSTGPQGLIRWQSSAFNSFWQSSSPSLGSNGTGYMNTSLYTYLGASADEAGQLTDPTITQVPCGSQASPAPCVAFPGQLVPSAQTWLYYTAQVGGANFHFKLAIANMPLNQVVLTGEGKIVDIP